MAEKSGRDLARQRVPQPDPVEQMAALLEKHRETLARARTVVFKIDGRKVNMVVTFDLIEPQHY